MEQKRLDRKNLLVLGLAIAVIAALLIAAAVMKPTLNPTLGELAADPTAAAESSVPADASATAKPTPTAFLVVTVAGQMYEPIALYEEGRYTITRGEMVNVIEVAGDRVTMHSSTCDNQDCVLQGTVTLENRENRVLKNMILCLPNEVVLELYTPEEIAALLIDMAQEGGNE